MVTVVGTISERWLERDQFGSNPILEDPGSLDAVLQSHSIQLKLKDPRSVSQYGLVLLKMMLSIELNLLMIKTLAREAWSNGKRGRLPRRRPGFDPSIVQMVFILSGIRW